MSGPIARVDQASIDHEVNGEREVIEALFGTYIYEVSSRIIENKPDFDLSAFPKNPALEAPKSTASGETLESIWTRKTKGDTQVFKFDDPFGEVLKILLADAAIRFGKSTTSENEQLLSATSLLPEWGKTDPYAMGTACVDQCFRELVASGANPESIALIENCDITAPDQPEQLGALIEAIKGIAKAAEVYQAPFLDHSETFSQPATDFTVVTKGLGIIDDVRHATTNKVKGYDSILAIIGTTENPLGGSVLARKVGITDAYVPETHLRKNIALYHSVHDGIKYGWIQSAQSISEGGLAVALAKIGISGNYGLEMSIDQLPTCGKLGKTSMLFNESPGRLIIEIKPADFHMVEALFAGQAFGKLGKINPSRENLSIRRGDEILIDESISELKAICENRP